MIYIGYTILNDKVDQKDVFSGFLASFLSLLIGCVTVTLGLVMVHGVS